MSDIRLCHDVYVSGPRQGRPCPYKAIAFIDFGAMTFQVCGYHARAYAPRAVYPFAWSLSRIREWQMSNLDRIGRRSHE